METTAVLFSQMLRMLLYLLPGYLLCKKGLITEVGSREFGNLLLYAILPVTIFSSYDQDFSTAKAITLAVAAGLAAMALILCVIISRIVFPNQALEHFGAAFSNAGFIGIPLVRAVVGNKAVFYAAPYVALLNMAQWTYGVYAITRDRKNISMRKILLNPVMVSFALGLLLFVLPVRLPQGLVDVCTVFSSMNGFLAMFLVGIYLAQSGVKDVFVHVIAYKAALLRLVIIPFAVLLMLQAMPVSNDVKQTILILTAAPVGTNVAVFAKNVGKDCSMSVNEICLSTLLCIVTIPLLFILSSKLF